MQSGTPQLIPSKADVGFDVAREIAAVRPALMAYVASILPQARHETDDVVQETCVMLWEKRDEFQSGTNFKAWAFRTAYFKVLAMRRDLTRNKITVFSDQMIQRLAGPAEDAAARIDLRLDALRHCIAAMTLADRRILDLKYVQRVSLADQARDAGIPPGRVQRAVSRLRLVLKRCIEKRTYPS